jgi:hypothetical protein
VGFEVADCDVAASSWEAVFDLVKGISCDPFGQLASAAVGRFGAA